MIVRRFWLAFLSLMLIIPVTIGTCVVAMRRRATIEDTKAQIERIADGLDQRTTATASYIRANDVDIDESDVWGTPISVQYSQGGIAESLSVRSAGPDRRPYTSDDVVADRSTANFKGIGVGIKHNVAETAANAAKGIVKGTVDGVKETFKGTLTFRTQPEENEDGEGESQLER